MSSSKSKRIQVIFTEKQYDIIQKLKGEMGDSDSEVIRNVVINWLMDKSFISSVIKKRI